MFLTLMIGLTLMTPANPSCDCCDFARFASDPDFVAAHLPPIAFHYAPEKGRNVTYPVAGEKEVGAFYVPPTAKPDAAIVMIHEWWGLNDYIRREAERLGEETGAAVLAVDLYQGKVATNPEEASKLMQGVQSEDATANLRAGFEALKTGRFGAKATQFGTTGYCFGGGWSHRAAILGGPAVKACVIYYGMPEMSLESLRKLSAPVLMIHPTQDKWITREVVANFAEAMKKVGKKLEIRSYDADHAFANPSNPRYDKANADDAARAVRQFFAEHLR